MYIFNVNTAAAEVNSDKMIYLLKYNKYLATINFKFCTMILL